MDQTTDQKIEALEKSIASLGHELKSIAEALSTGFTKVGANFGAVKKDLDTLHAKVDLLRLETTGGLVDVGVKIEGLTDEIVKINKVTHYEAEFQNTQAFKN